MQNPNFQNVKNFISSLYSSLIGCLILISSRRVGFNPPATIMQLILLSLNIIKTLLSQTLSISMFNTNALKALFINISTQPNLTSFPVPWGYFRFSIHLANGKKSINSIFISLLKKEAINVAIFLIC